MERLKFFCVSNKKDLICLLLLFVIFILYSIIFWGSWGSLFVDNGREAYLPQIMLQGKVLYKDIFAMYNPFGYQINAVIYSVFKADINTLQICGSIATFLILSGLYFISRLFIKPNYAFAFCLFAAAQYIFSSFSCINYIFPYSYGMLYSLMFFIWFVLVSLLYLKSDKKSFLYASSVLLGLSIACRFEFSLCVLPFLAVMIYKKENIKSIISNIIIILLPLILSWGIIFLQGLTISEFGNYIKFIQNLFATKEQHMFNQGIASTFSFESILKITSTFCLAIAFLVINSSAVSLIINKKNIFLKILLCLILLIANIFIVKEIIISKTILFSWCALTAIIIGILSLKNHNKLLALLSFYAVISCLRVNLVLISSSSYSIYFVLLPLLVNWVFFIKTENKFVSRFDLKKPAAIFLIIFSVITTLFHVYTKKGFYYTVYTTKGKVSNYSHHAKVFEKSVKWVEQNTNSDDEVLVLPEGTMINFITGRPTNNKYYHLIPNHIAALGEASIVNALTQNPPAYILINNLEYKMYGNLNMCKTFGMSICKFVKRNYNYKTRLDSGKHSNEYFYIDVYKLKKTDG